MPQNNGLLLTISEYGLSNMALYSTLLYIIMGVINNITKK